MNESRRYITGGAIHANLPTPQQTSCPLSRLEFDPAQIRLLLVDDDKVLSEMLKEYLESEQCQVMLASSGHEAVRLLGEKEFDLLVLDIMMPGPSGIEVLKQIRTTRSIPVIMLTARGDDLDRIIGLELGADDYLAKPCNPRELYARIRAVLRRNAPPAMKRQPKIDLDDLRMIPERRELQIRISDNSNGHDLISLTQTEFDLLYLLLQNAGSLVSKSEISTRVLGKPLSQWDRSIDMHISNLRKKLGKHHNGKERIQTLRGSGYIYRPGTNEL
ncbi:MAG: response regulator [Gammaproteobacteria bacterium]|nr:response regulator [Gammaproteobacteria bacterium]